MYTVDVDDTQLHLAPAPWTFAVAQQRRMAASEAAHSRSVHSVVSDDIACAVAATARSCCRHRSRRTVMADVRSYKKSVRSHLSSAPLSLWLLAPPLAPRFAVVLAVVSCCDTHESSDDTSDDPSPTSSAAVRYRNNHGLERL